MISVQEAFGILKNNLPQPVEVEISLSECTNHILAKDVFSPIDMPPFRQSAMDGFALCLHDSLKYEILGEVKAGDGHVINLKPGQAVKIFTGAAVPDSAQAIIQVEKTNIIEGKLVIEHLAEIGTNIRPIGEQTAKSSLAYEKGNILNPAAIGFLAGLGITKVNVFKKPTIGIIVTGNELVKSGQELSYGQIYESNGIMLESALKNNQFSGVKNYRVNDDFENTKSTIAKALEENDVILISGGISVGDYDFVEEASNQLGVETLFYKVNQKPGKPLLAGKIDKKMVFALPGNPAASLTCFYIYVLPSLQIMAGKTTFFDTEFKYTLAHDCQVKNTRSQFLKASLKMNQVEILSHQNSSMLNTFARANGLIHLPEGEYFLKQGSEVDFYHTF